MFERSRFFRLIVDEVEKCLAQVDLAIAREYAALVPSASVRDEVYGMVEEEYRRTVERVLGLSGATGFCTRFPRFQRRLARRLTIINQVGQEQVRLIRRFREAPAEAGSAGSSLCCSRSTASPRAWDGPASPEAMCQAL